MATATGGFPGNEVSSVFLSAIHSAPEGDEIQADGEDFASQTNPDPAASVSIDADTDRLAASATEPTGNGSDNLMYSGGFDIPPK